MNVLLVTNTLHRGGAEEHLRQLGRGLLARGVHCEVGFLRSHVPGGSVDLREAFEADGLRTHYLQCERSWDPRAGWRVHRLAAAGRWDVLHSHLPRADAAAFVAHAIRPAQTWVATLHHPYDNAYAGAPLVPVFAAMWRRADGVIAVSEPVRQWAIARAGIAPARVRTVVHGVAVRPRELTPPRLDQRAAIATIGRLEPRKNHETLIRAMTHVLPQVPHATLTIAGHDPWGYGRQLRDLIAQLGLERHVELVGFVSDRETFFAGADVFAFASRSEGFGIVVIEAMEAGKPCVVTDIAPLNTIITPGDSGLVARPDDAEHFAGQLLTLLQDPARLARVAERARVRVAEEFSEDAMVDRTLAWYQDVLQRRGVRVAV